MTYNKNRPFHSVDSVIPLVAERIARYAFRDAFIKLHQNGKTMTYDIYVNNSIDEEHAKDFVSIWGKRWVIKIVQTDEIGME